MHVFITTTPINIHSKNQCLLIQIIFTLLLLLLFLFKKKKANYICKLQIIIAALFFNDFLALWFQHAMNQDKFEESII
jgi:hypothetical protein